MAQFAEGQHPAALFHQVHHALDGSHVRPPDRALKIRIGIPNFQGSRRAWFPPLSVTDMDNLMILIVIFCEVCILKIGCIDSNFQGNMEMIDPSGYLEQIRFPFEVHPVVAVLGARQCGKTTLHAEGRTGSARFRSRQENRI